MITLYSTHCPKCKVLELKLNQKKVDFNVIDNPDAVVAFGAQHNIMSAPILDVDGCAYDFSDAVKFLNNI